jgi:maltoporin
MSLKAAPEITFWAGERFYRFDIDPMDYYWLDMSGYGAGVKNINIGSASSSSPIWVGWMTI